MKQIPLTQGKFALVDDEDFDFLMQWKWSYHSLGYAVRYDKRRAILLHRTVNNTPVGFDTDHINGDKLDNRKKNLRPCSHAENTRNRKFRSKSGFKGVYFQEKYNNYRAVITVDGKFIHLGTFININEAAESYNSAAKKLHGEFCALNKIPCTR